MSVRGKINVKVIKAFNGESLLLDDEDYDRLNQFKWSITADGYATNRIYGETTYLHHSVLGNPPKNNVVHHKDGDKLNNQKSNLEFVTRSIHKLNHPRKPGKSGYYGVYAASDGSGWQAKMKFNGIRYYLGTFNTKEAAAKAHDKKAIELHGTYANLNFPL